MRKLIYTMALLVLGVFTTSAQYSITMSAVSYADCEGENGAVHIAINNNGIYGPTNVILVIQAVDAGTLDSVAVFNMITYDTTIVGLPPNDILIAYARFEDVGGGPGSGHDQIISEVNMITMDCYASPNCAGQIMHTNGLGAVNWYVDGSYVSTGDSLDLSSYIGDTASVEAFSVFDTTVVAWMGDVYPRHGAEIVSVMDDFCFSSSGSASVGLMMGWGTLQTTFLWSNGDSSSTASGLSAGTYTVVVDNGFGCVETLSVVVGDTCNISTGVTDHEDSPSFSVYPNPTTDRVNITSTQEVLSGEILNTLGQAVMILPRLTGKNTSLDVSDLERGQYFIRLQVGDRFVTERLVVN